MNKKKVHRGSDNVIADIGVAHPKRVMARAQIMSRITEIIKERGLTPQEAAKLLDIPQSKVSCLMNGKLSMFSLDHLFELLNSLDRNVEIIIKPKTKREKFATTHVLMVPSFQMSICQYSPIELCQKRFSSSMGLTDE
jgi:predicted XRE-type DNA-binding protein